MNDVQRLGRAVEHVHERAAIVELLDGAVHLVEPRTRFLRRGVAAETTASNTSERRSELGTVTPPGSARTRAR